jgi:hypothetical protein
MDAADVPRIRTLKPEHKVHRKVGRLEDRPYRLWVGLITEADDHGRFVADAEQLRALIFPYQRIGSAQVETALHTLERTRLVHLYTVNGTRYGCFPDWQHHQKVSHAIPSRIPPCSEESGTFQNPPESSSLARARGSDHEGKRRDQGREGIKEGSAVASGDFARFWEAYPKRIGKGEAQKAWEKHRPPLEAVLTALDRQRAWLGREGGKYIPNPATWLNQGRWEDDPPTGDPHTRRNVAGIQAWLDAQPPEAP